MTRQDQVILVLAAAAMIFATLHMLRDTHPRATWLAVAVICLALIPIVKRYFFT